MGQNIKKAKGAYHFWFVILYLLEHVKLPDRDLLHVMCT